VAGRISALFAAIPTSTGLVILDGTNDVDLSTLGLERTTFAWPANDS
jgi:hypothetical protein